MLHNPIEILIAGIRWPPETFIERKIDYLIRQGFRVTVATKDPTSGTRAGLRFIQAARLSKSSVIFTLLLTITKLLTAPRVTLKAWAIACADNQTLRDALLSFLGMLPLIALKPNIIHFEWNTAATALLPYFELISAPIVISCRGSQLNIAPHNPRREQYTRDLSETFKRAEAIHCVSDDLRQEAVKYGADPRKCWVIRPAVDPQFFRPAREPINGKGTLTVMSTGSIIWRKGYEYALLAIRKLVNDGIDVQYVIIGDGPDRQRILFTIDDLGLKAHVRLTGRLTAVEVRDQLQQADIFLLSSLSEGISNAVLEAMACGLPVVTTDCGGMREAVTDGVEGFVVPVRDPVAIANALMILLDETTLRTKLGVNARYRVLREFSLSSQAEAFREIYTNVCSNSTILKVATQS